MEQQIVDVFKETLANMLPADVEMLIMAAVEVQERI